MLKFRMGWKAVLYCQRLKTPTKGREYVISGHPFTVAPDKDGIIPGRLLYRSPGWDTTITTNEWALLYSLKDPCELYHLPSDPNQEKNVIKEHPEEAKELYSYLIKFMRENKQQQSNLLSRD